MERPQPPERTPVAVHPFHTGFRAVGALVLGLSGLLAAIVVPFVILGDAPLAVVLVITPCLGFFAAIGGYAFFRHRGGVALLARGVALVRRGRVLEQIRYADLTGIDFFDRHIPPNVTLRAGSKTLRFSGSIEQAPTFFEGLFHRAPALIASRKIALPLFLDARPALLRDFLGGAGVLAVLFYGILAYSLWAHGRAQLSSGLIAISLIWVFFVAIVGLVAVRPGEPIRVLIDDVGTDHPQVRAWTFFGREVAIHFDRLASVRIVDRTSDVGDGGVTVRKQSFPIRFRPRPEEGPERKQKYSRSIYVDELLARSVGHTPTSLLAAIGLENSSSLPIHPFDERATDE